MMEDRWTGTVIELMKRKECKETNNEGVKKIQWVTDKYKKKPKKLIGKREREE